MTTTTVTISVDQLDALLEKVTSSLNTTELLDEAAAILLNKIRTRFLAELDPDEVPWLPSRAGLRRKARGGPGTLFDTGRLFRSIQLVSVWESSDTEARAIQSATPYGHLHQYGEDGRPVRRFLGFNEKDADLVLRFIDKRIKEALG